MHRVGSAGNTAGSSRPRKEKRFTYVLNDADNKKVSSTSRTSYPQNHGCIQLIQKNSFSVQMSHHAFHCVYFSALCWDQLLVIPKCLYFWYEWLSFYRESGWYLEEVGTKKWSRKLLSNFWVTCWLGMRFSVFTPVDLILLFDHYVLKFY